MKRGSIDFLGFQIFISPLPLKKSFLLKFPVAIRFSSIKMQEEIAS